MEPRPPAVRPLRFLRGSGRGAAVLGLGTALPEARVEQGVAAEAVIRLAGLDGTRAAWTRRVFERAGVGSRRTVWASHTF